MRPQSFKVLPWRPQERSLGAPRRLKDDLRADFTPSRIHCYGQCFQHIKGRAGRLKLRPRGASGASKMAPKMSLKKFNFFFNFFLQILTRLKWHLGLPTWQKYYYL